MIEKIKSFANDEKWMEILFTLMILSFPFGSFFLSFSVGFMTIYPYLILVCLLTFLGFFRASKIEKGIEKYFLFFLLFFFVYALAFVPFIDGKNDAIIDLRSIALMLLTTYVFISTQKILGFEKWKSTVLFSFKSIFFMLIIFAVFEMISEFHFAGTFTNHLIDRGLHDIINSSPVFLWDNPNTFNAYLFSIGFVIILLEPSGKVKNYLKWFILAVCFFFSFIIQSRIGIALSLFIIAMTIVYELIIYFKNRPERRAVYYLIFVMFALAFVFVTNEKFYKIPEDKVKVYTNYVLKNPPPVIESADPVVSNPVVLDTENNVAISAPYRNSNSERKALFLNGVDFIFDSKFLGVGPGQYRYLHDIGKINHFAYGNNGAHFWFLELLSQYGIFVFSGYLFLFAWIKLIALKSRKLNSELTWNIFISLICFVGVSIMPSGFLVRDINWMFVAILVIVATNFSSKKSETN